MGFDASDDACVYRISDELALVQTVDFFPPLVDDPFIFGQIAAANALSDVYAMGGRPVLALNLLAFPSCLDIAVAGRILAGGADKAREAGCIIAGGHSISDNEPKYGLSVTGFVHPDRVLTNVGAVPGDSLILSKALGVGVLTTAYKGGLIAEAGLAPALDSMRALNRAAAEAAAAFDVHACTDVTGFGLIGHSCELAGAGDITVELEARSLPLLPQVRELAQMGLLAAGCHRNRQHFQERVGLSAAVDLELTDIMYDPQTSGGLLLALPASQAPALLERLLAAGCSAALVGQVRERREQLDVTVR